MYIVVKVVNSILSHSLNHRQFQLLLEKVNEHYIDLLFFCEVRWLSRGAMLSRVCDLKQEISNFLHQKKLPYADKFFDPRWLACLALLTDISTHLNALNLKPQGKEVLVTDMYCHIIAFEVKLRLWEAQLADSQFAHFPCLSACDPDTIDPNTCVSVVSSLRQEFASRFKGVKVLAGDFKLFTAPFDVAVNDVAIPLQMEIIELQCNEELKAKFRTSSPLSFFRDYLHSDKFPKL
ncbi:hypothetical protein Pmani_001079 [Petrolisthes manimaculis]|uniref:Uncharacterized protein n=1 Tax=Petrolisthes manimaculis TaxID=1843537 RepID=A0AAE1QN25_9EUCA|nr:hypothetical protein Pmani_001079 [Petrolisthes manimaculis]